MSFYCVIDFECTCDENRTWTHEIIEFPCILVSRDTKEVINQFHQYVQPTECPMLTNFCTKLTGITQNRVKKAQSLDNVLKNFDKWLHKNGLFKEDGSPDFYICTDGPWDIESFLYKVTIYPFLL